MSYFVSGKFRCTAKVQASLNVRSSELFIVKAHCAATSKHDYFQNLWTMEISGLKSKATEAHHVSLKA